MRLLGMPKGIFEVIITMDAKEIVISVTNGIH